MLRNAEVANVKNHAVVSWSNLGFFLPRLPAKLSKDILQAGFLKYETFPLPVEVTRSDRVRHELRLWKDLDGTQPYQELACAMLGILSIPHSNPDAERIFSLVRKNRSETRAFMSISTIEALLVNKLGGRVCINDTMLKTCKRSTLESLNSWMFLFFNTCFISWVKTSLLFKYLFICIIVNYSLKFNKNSAIHLNFIVIYFQNNIRFFIK